MPFFSIIIPSYNRAHLLQDTLNCILGQTEPDFELIIIDDASTDTTEELIKNIQDTRIRYTKNKINLERSASRNKGIELANGRFICFCDSDDHWHKNHLSVIKEAICTNAHKDALYFTGMIWCFPDRKQEVLFPLPEGNLIEYVISNQIAPSTACISASILRKHQFNEDLKINEDVELFSRIVSENDLIQVPVATIDFNIHQNNTKALTKDYIYPQMQAMEMIFNHPSLKHKISSSFKTKVRRNLLHQLLQFLRDTNQPSKISYFSLKFLILYPFDTTRKEKLILFLYNLPGGFIFKNIVQKLMRINNR